MITWSTDLEESVQLTRSAVRVWRSTQHRRGPVPSYTSTTLPSSSSSSCPAAWADWLTDTRQDPKKLLSHGRSCCWSNPPLQTLSTWAEDWPRMYISDRIRAGDLFLATRSQGRWTSTNLGDVWLLGKPFRNFQMLFSSFGSFLKPEQRQTKNSD